MNPIVTLSENWALMLGPSSYPGGLYSTMINDSIDIGQITENEVESFISTWFVSAPQIVNTQFNTRKYSLRTPESLFEISFSDEDQAEGIWICSEFSCCSTIERFTEFADKIAMLNPNIVLHSPECELIPIHAIPDRYSEV